MNQGSRSVGQGAKLVVLGWIAIIIISFPACGLIQRPEPGIVIQDDFSICLTQSTSGELVASIRPVDCYSFRAFRTQEQSSVAVINNPIGTVRFHSTFKLQPIRSLLPTTPDCLGGGQLSLNLGSLKAGSYELFAGDLPLGRVELPADLPWCSEISPG